MSKVFHVCDKLIHDERLSCHFGPYPQCQDSNPISVGLHALSIPCSNTCQSCYNDLSKVVHLTMRLGGSCILLWDQARSSVREKCSNIRTKTIIFWVKHLEIIETYQLNWIFFHDTLYCCIWYSNMKYQDEIFKTYHKK